MANTTHTEFAPGQLEIPAPVTDRRSTYAGELSRAQSDLAAAEARAAELALTVERQRRCCGSRSPTRPMTASRRSGSGASRSPTTRTSAPSTTGSSKRSAAPRASGTSA